MDSPRTYVGLRAWQHDGYWHVEISVDYEDDTIDTVDSRRLRINENIPESAEWKDQAWVVLAYAMKTLEHAGAGGRSGGMEFPALF